MAHNDRNKIRNYTQKHLIRKKSFNHSFFNFPVVRVAFVGFRDFVDGNKIFSVHDFTSDIGAIKSFISNQQPIEEND